MAFPADAFLAGKHTHDGSAVRDDDEHGEQDRTDLSLKEPHRDDVPKDAEDHAAGTDVHRVADREQTAEKPDTQSADDGGHREHDEELGATADHQHPAKESERDRVCAEVRKAAVQERREENARETIDATRSNPKLVEPSTDKCVDEFDAPHEREQSKQEERDGFEASPQGFGVALVLCLRSHDSVLVLNRRSSES